MAATSDDPASAGRSGTSWATARRKALREQRRYQCIPDPSRPGKRVNPLADCPHGTIGGYDNWGCQCDPVPGTGMWETPQPGCEAAKLAQQAERREKKRSVSVTKPLPVTRRRKNTPPPPGVESSGRHRKPTA